MTMNVTAMATATDSFTALLREPFTIISPLAFRRRALGF